MATCSICGHRVDAYLIVETACKQCREPVPPLSTPPSGKPDIREIEAAAGAWRTCLEQLAKREAEQGTTLADFLRDGLPAHQSERLKVCANPVIYK